MPIIKTYIVPHPPLIIPDIGKGQEKKIHKTVEAYHKVAKDIAKLKPDTIIISSPHATMYADYFHISPRDNAYGDFRNFGAEDVRIEIKYDHNLRLDIANACKANGIPAGMMGEKQAELDHGTLIPLYFITRYYHDFKMIRISPSGLPMIDHYTLGKLISSVIPEDVTAVWVASGDLSHKLKEDGPYGLAKEGIEFDEKINRIIKNGEFMDILSLNPDFCYKAAECGLGSITMMLGTLDEHEVVTKILSYENIFGVGYMVAEIEKLGIDTSRKFASAYLKKFASQLEFKRQAEDPYVKLARMSLEYYVTHHAPMPIPDEIEPELLKKRAGAFVSLHIDGHLRGCIGTIRPTEESIAEEIIQNAISAGSKDYRFNEVKASELDKIDYSVDELKTPETISSIEDLDVKRYGLIVQSGYKSGVLLPNIDGVDTVEDQIRIAKRKAGIDDDETFSMQRFEVIRHH